MPRPTHRFVAALCYLGALRVPLVALMLPQWAFTVPSGLLVAGAAWGYGLRRSPFLLHHGREGFIWAVQANLLLAGIALVARGFHFGWVYTNAPVLDSLWRLGATLSQWTGLLVSVLTLFAMARAARGSTSDVFTLPGS